ncbi:LETM1 and EF-hand domain-containing protein 1, mitochondrial [Madurella mycetomatis]|uniref:LETM1 and EF-hand domain-containing protein 1, mitochondrial n=1 Tax=Madurella mycetomatis TaxID=100816 RepID=A0A175W0P4_9PEZI|nr:LETM1 and EF-hand domain-containing protein 1, mitochondrial [Madurella mycetomatis]
MRHSTILSSALRAHARPTPVDDNSAQLFRGLSRTATCPATPNSKTGREQYHNHGSDNIHAGRARRFPCRRQPPVHDPPPPLDLPVRQPGTTTFNHLFATGKAFLTFYKTGLKYIYTNTRLLYPSTSSSSTNPSDTQARPPYPSTRADLHLRLRWRHDIRRLPLFALMLLICGEFTPFVVLVLPRVVPLTCRIPQQVDKLLRGEEARRRRGREAARESVAAVGEERGSGKGGSVKPLAEVLGVSNFSWTPRFVLAPRVRARLKFLAVDDALLVQAGGEPALVADEVRLACADRGIAVLGRSVEEMREALGKWLRLTDVTELGEEGSEKARVRLLLTEEGEWGA